MVTWRRTRQRGLDRRGGCAAQRGMLTDIDDNLTKNRIRLFCERVLPLHLWKSQSWTAGKNETAQKFRGKQRRPNEQCQIGT